MEIETFVPTEVFAKTAWADAWGDAISYLRAIEWRHCLAPAMPSARLAFRYGKGKPPEAAVMAAHAKQDLAGKFIQIRATFPDSAGTATSTVALKLVDSGARFISDDHLLPGTPVTNTTDGTETVITKVDAETELSVEEDIFVIGKVYSIGGERRVWTGFMPTVVDAVRGAGGGLQAFRAKGLEFLLGVSDMNGAKCEGAVGKEIAAGASDGTEAFYLIDSTATFITDGVRIGMTVRNLTDEEQTTVTGVVSETKVALYADIIPTGKNYDIRNHLIDEVPAFNERYGRGGTERGNRSDVVNDNAVFEFSADGGVWTHQDIAEYLLMYFGPKMITWELAGANDLLDALTTRQNFAGKDIWQCLNRLVDRRRGLAWHIPNADFDADDTVKIEVVSRFEADIVEGALTVTANPKQVVVIGDDPVSGEFDRDKTDCQITENRGAYYDRIVVRGIGLTCFSVSVKDLTLEKAWFGLSGTTTGAAASKLIDAAATFSASGVLAGMFVKNTSTQATTTVSAVDSEIQLSLTADIMGNGDKYEIGLEADYRHVGGADAKVNDRSRASDRFEGVFSHFRIPRGFAWQTGDGEGGGLDNNALPQWTNGSYDAAKVGGYWNYLRRLHVELPLLNGYDYENYVGGVSPTNRNPLSAEPEYRKPFAVLAYGGFWHYAHDVSFVEAARRRGCDLSISERGMGVIVKASPAHLLALNHWTGARPTEVEPVFDWEYMIVTVCAVMDDRPYRACEVNAPGAAEVPRTLTIDLPDCEVHHVATETIIGVDLDGNLQKFDKPVIIRDDSAKMAAVIAAARAWYSVPRKMLVYGQKRLLMNLAPGTLVTDVNIDGAMTVVDTVVESRAYNALAGTTTVRTGLGSINFSTFATAGQQRVDRKEVAQMARDVDVLKREAAVRPLRPAASPGERVGPLTFKFIGDLSEEDIDPYWSGGLTYPTAAGETKELYNAVDGSATDVRLWYSDPVRAGHVRRLEAHMQNRLTTTNAMKVYPVIYLAGDPCPGTDAYPLVLTVGGAGLDPDCKGTYVRCGNYNDKPCYVRLDGAFWVFWNTGTNEWYIARIKGEGTDYWDCVTLVGNYVDHGAYAGTPKPAITPWATLTNSANRSPRSGVPVQYGGGVEADELVSVLMEATVIDVGGWGYEDVTYPLIKAIVEHEPVVR